MLHESEVEIRRAIRRWTHLDAYTVAGLTHWVKEYMGYDRFGVDCLGIDRAMMCSVRKYLTSHPARHPIWVAFEFQNDSGVVCVYEVTAKWCSTSKRMAGGVRGFFGPEYDERTLWARMFSLGDLVVHTIQDRVKASTPIFGRFAYFSSGASALVTHCHLCRRVSFFLCRRCNRTICDSRCICDCITWL